MEQTNVDVNAIDYPRFKFHYVQMEPVKSPLDFYRFIDCLNSTMFRWNFQ